jgi:hypothetical protein
MLPQASTRGASKTTQLTSTLNLSKYPLFLFSGSSSLFGTTSPQKEQDGDGEDDKDNDNDNDSNAP